MVLFSAGVYDFFLSLVFPGPTWASLLQDSDPSSGVTPYAWTDTLVFINTLVAGFQSHWYTISCAAVNQRQGTFASTFYNLRPHIIDIMHSREKLPFSSYTFSLKLLTDFNEFGTETNTNLLRVLLHNGTTQLDVADGKDDFQVLDIFANVVRK